MTLKFRKSALNKKPQRNKDLAFGYIRSCEKKKNLPIPEMIKYLSLIYLNQNKDKFDPDRTNEWITIDGNNVKSKLDHESYVKNAYLMNQVTNGTHIWRFEINGCYNWDQIGISSCYCPSIKSIEDYQFFVYDLLSPDNRGSSTTIIEMSANFNSLTLSFRINDVDYGSVFDIKPGKYKAAFSICKGSYTLLSYQKIY